MTRKNRNTEATSIQGDSLLEKAAPVIVEPPKPPKPTVADGKEAKAVPVKKKRIRHRQTVKLHNKKLSVSVICSNPYLRQFL
jgi:hypothetical protein